ncbi:MAG: DUF3592 domain-containing protein [Clostridia bacterium]|nr:DUF3592 domain-containing protein [Clostridia bacterium]
MRFQEEAARKREEIAKTKRLKRIKDAWWLIGVAGIMLVVSLGFTVWTIAQMHNFETNYLTVIGTVSDYEVQHGTLTNRHGRTTYTLVISYTVDGQTYKFSDIVAYRERPTDMIGTMTEVYVNPQNPELAKKLATADDPSIASAIIFPFGAIVYALGVLLLLQEKRSTFVKRLLRIWLPIFLWCAISVLLFWIGLPNDGFGAVFSRVEGTIGYAVVAGITLLTLLIDAIISKKKSSSLNTAKSNN